MTEDITRNGVEPTGRHEPHYGDEKRVYDEVTLGVYDANNDGAGNFYDVTHVYGFARLLNVDVQVIGAESYEARYDYANNSIRVFDLGSGDEVAQGVELNLDLRLRIEGTGT